jgi:hypothetical protein
MRRLDVGTHCDYRDGENGFLSLPEELGNGALSFIVVSRVFPPIALALPFFLQFRAIGLIDTPFGLIVAYLPIVLPLMIWMLHGFFRDFPNEILEAAEIDGLGALETLMRIVIPCRCRRSAWRRSSASSSPGTSSSSRSPSPGRPRPSISCRSSSSP